MAQHSDDVAFPVSGFRFTGNTVFSQEELTELLEDRTGQQLTLAQLEEAAARITRFYRDHGYLFATAYVPPQEVVDGAVEIAIMEGRYGDVVLQNTSGLREGTASALLGAVQPGALIESGALDRAIRLLDETPGVQARARLEAGSEPGTADLTVELTPSATFNPRLTVDNGGSVFVGRLQTSVAVGIENPAGLGDRLSLRWLGTSPEMSNGYIGYEAMLGAPWRWGISYASTQYTLGEPFEALDATGTANVLQLAAHYPLTRSGGNSLDLSFSYDMKTLRDSLLGEETPARVQAFTTLGRWTRRGSGTAGSGEAWVSLTLGRLAFLNETAAEEDADTANAAGTYVILEAGVTGRKPLSPRSALHVSASGQWASKNLYRSEKFSLGGPDGVRAYPVGEASGDLGFLLRADARYAPPVSGRWAQALEMGAFVDFGVVKINKQPWLGAGDPQSRTLMGGGIGLTYAPTSSSAVRIEYAVPFGGGDAAGSTPEPQLWLRLETRL